MCVDREFGGYPSAQLVDVEIAAVDDTISNGNQGFQALAFTGDCLCQGKSTLAEGMTATGLVEAFDEYVVSGVEEQQFATDPSGTDRRQGVRQIPQVLA